MGKSTAALLLLGCVCSTLASRYLARGVGVGPQRPTRPSREAFFRRTTLSTPASAVATSGSSLDGARRISTFSLSGPCDPSLNNTSWFDGCNTCICNKGTLAACTLMRCPGNYQTTPGCPVGSKNGDTWFAACNVFTCVVLPYGSYTTRTLKGRCWEASKSRNPKVSLHQQRHEKAHSLATVLNLTKRASGPCDKGNTWFDGCNNCRCMDGRPAICTKMYCFDNEQLTTGCPSDRIVQETWYADCNRHTCIRGGNGSLKTLSTVKGACW